MGKTTDLGERLGGGHLACPAFVLVVGMAGAFTLLNGANKASTVNNARMGANNLARELGMRALWVKDDSANPTHSFKDRVVSLAATAAKGLGYTKIAAASTGNLANSVAAHAARAGLPSVVFIPSDLEPGKVVQSAVYGQTLVAVDGSYDDVNRLTSELAETDEFEDTAFVNQNVRPYYAVGSKTMGYEIA